MCVRKVTEVWKKREVIHVVLKSPSARVAKMWSIYSSCVDFAYLFSVGSSGTGGPLRRPSFSSRSLTHLLFASSTQSHFGLHSLGAASPCAGVPSSKWSVWCSKWVSPLILMVVLR